MANPLEMLGYATFQNMECQSHCENSDACITFPTDCPEK
jgi:hypothetical protein